MRKVIDSNQLQSDTLRSYLAKSKRNCAVLIDYVAMEAYKGDTLNSIYKSMAIVADFPHQVLVLKGTAVVCGLSGRGAGLQKRLIDKAQTREFAKYTHMLHLAKNGNLTLQNLLLNHGKAATVHLDGIVEDARSTGMAFNDITKIHSKDEKRLARKGEPYTSKMIDKIVVIVMRIA